MANGQTEQAAAALTPAQLQEIEKLNLHPRQRRLLEQVLIDSPGLSIPEAHQMLSSSGM